MVSNAFHLRKSGNLPGHARPILRCLSAPVKGLPLNSGNEKISNLAPFFHGFLASMRLRAKFETWIKVEFLVE
jgi:hypothetical protein